MSFIPLFCTLTSLGGEEEQIYVVGPGQYEIAAKHLSDIEKQKLKKRPVENDFINKKMRRKSKTW